MFRKITISNKREALSVLEENYPKYQKDYWKEMDIDACDVAIFWGGSDTATIMPRQVPDWLVDHIISVMKYSSIIILSPQNPSDSICQDIHREELLQEFLIQDIENQSKAISFYSATEQALALKKWLMNKSMKFKFPDLPNFDNSWTANYFDSKVGFRNLVFQIFIKQNNINIGIKLPESYVCDNIREVKEVTKVFKNSNRNYIIKGNRGVGGYENKIILLKKDEKDGVIALENDFKHWSSRSYVIEEFIKVDPTNHLSYPSINSIITTSGKLVVRGIYSQIIAENCIFEGIISEQNLYTHYYIEKMNKFNRIVGNILSSYGYIGHYNIDFILSEDGDIYVTEINLRRTGGTHVLDIVNHLNVSDRCVISMNEYLSENIKDIDISAFKKILNNWVFDWNNKEGVIVTMGSGLEHGRGFGFVVVSKDYETGTQLKKCFIKAIELDAKGKRLP